MATATMVNLSIDGVRSFVLPSLSVFEQGKIALAALLALSPLSPASASTEVTPFLNLEVSAVDSELATTMESGEITTLAPGVSVIREGTKASLRLDYQYRAIQSHGLEQEDREVNVLSLDSLFQHRPGFWISSLSASSRLTEIDIDGIQSADGDFISDNTTEIRTIGIDTSVTDFVTGKVRYLARLGADFTDLEDGDDSEGYGFLLEFDTLRSPDRFVWRTSLNSKVSRNEEVEEQIDQMNLNLTYRINKTWSVFADGTTYETDRAELDEDRRLLGINWRPTSRTTVSLGAGELGNDKTYSLYASHARKTVNFYAAYDEKITTAREEIFDRLLAELMVLGYTLSISVDPILEKRMTLSLSIGGLHSDVVLSAFDVDRSGGVTVIDQSIQGLRATFLRRLNPRNTISLSAGVQETSAGVDNELSSLAFDFSRRHSLNETFKFTLGWAEQQSSLKSNEYERTSVGAVYRITF